MKTIQAPEKGDAVYNTSEEYAGALVEGETPIYDYETDDWQATALLLESESESLVIIAARKVGNEFFWYIKNELTTDEDYEEDEDE